MGILKCLFSVAFLTEVFFSKGGLLEYIHGPSLLNCCPIFTDIPIWEALTKGRKKEERETKNKKEMNKERKETEKKKTEGKQKPNSKGSKHRRI